MRKIGIGVAILFVLFMADYMTRHMVIGGGNPT